MFVQKSCACGSRSSSSSRIHQRLRTLQATHIQPWLIPDHLFHWKPSDVTARVLNIGDLLFHQRRGLWRHRFPFEWRNDVILRHFSHCQATDLTFKLPAEKFYHFFSYFLGSRSDKTSLVGPFLQHSFKSDQSMNIYLHFARTPNFICSILKK